MKIDVTEPSTLLSVLEKAIGGASRSKVRKFLKFGSVRVNARVAKLANLPVSPGDRIEVAIDKRRRAASDLAPPFPILYEDAGILAVEKPPGILTSNAPEDSGRSLHREIDRYLRERSQGRDRAMVVHRLDREVSGIVLFTKSDGDRKRLKERWRKVEKLYYALVEGRPPETEGKIESMLKEDDRQRVYTAAEGEEGALRAVTRYRVLRMVGEYTLLEIRLETGRKNQIRVHLSELGCPVVGDRRYGASAEVIRRIRLHAFFIAFDHPRTERRIEIESPMPPAFLSPGKRDEKYK